MILSQTIADTLSVSVDVTMFRDCNRAGAERQGESEKDERAHGVSFHGV
jgi:hypothetical protein